MLINAVSYKNGQKAQNFTFNELKNNFSDDEQSLYWIAFSNPNTEEMEFLSKKMDLHELAIEDLTHGNQTSKVEEYDEHLFFVLKQLELVDQQLKIGDVYLFVSKNFIISVRTGCGEALNNVRKLVEKNQKLLQLGSGYIAYAILDAIVDRYFPISSKLEHQLYVLENQIFDPAHQDKAKTFQELHQLKSQIREMKNSVSPLLDSVHKLFGGRVPEVCDGLDNYYRDSHDHLQRILNSLDNMLETCNSSIQTGVALLTIEDNQITKNLAAFAGIFASMTFIAGIYGMNFDFMPELKWKYGYFAALGMMFCTGCGLYWKFYKAGWIKKKQNQNF